MRMMKYFRDVHLVEIKGASILDIGAKNYSKNSFAYRSLFELDYEYTGMDIEAGRNVDIVGYENINQVYDVVITEQTIEHVCRPWEWLKNLTQYYTKYICVIAPHTWREHRYPLDTYRYFPDGMRDLFNYAGIEELEISMDKADTIGIGTK